MKKVLVLIVLSFLFLSGCKEKLVISEDIIATDKLALEFWREEPESQVWENEDNGTFTFSPKEDWTLIETEDEYILSRIKND